MCAPTEQLTDLVKEALVKEAGYDVVRIGDLSVYVPDDTPVQKLTMENVVYGGKISEDVIHALIALDTELNSLHRLCMEQGPFFRCIFEEINSDALRHGLKQNLPRQPANQSHSEKGYWKKQITEDVIHSLIALDTFPVFPHVETRPDTSLFVLLATRETQCGPCQ
jgi:hypothetical protein